MKKFYYPQQRQQLGLSLVELMVAILVGSLLLVGVLQILTNSTQSYRIQNAFMRVQENGQFAMEFITREVRNTDFWGCLATLDDVDNLLDPAGGGYDPTYNAFAAGISGTANEASGGPIEAGTDTITIQAAANIGSGLPLQPPYGPLLSSPITVGPDTNIVQDDILIVSDCLQGNIFQVTAIDSNGSISHAAGVGSPGNISGDLAKIYTGEATVYRPYTRSFEIRTGTSGLPSLFLVDRNGPQELVEGVENMMILFGEDTDGDNTANRYVRANAVGDMGNVVSVRVSIVVESIEDNLAPTPQPYLLNGQVVTPADRRLRRIYNTTITLRNRSD